MQRLSASRLLNAWERGRRQSGLARAMLLLGAAEPGASPPALAALPIGRRDARILDLRVSVFGPRLEAVVSCPGCGERLEFTVAVSDLPRDEGDEIRATQSVSRDGYEIDFRCPTSADLATVAQRPEAERRSALLERCVVEARRDGVMVAAAAVPEPVVAAMLDRMAALDPAATSSISLSCPGCGHEWQSPFDIVSFLWMEVDAWALRTLREVHALASTYGWSEADIVAMSAWRRQRYVEMAGG